MDSAPMRTRPLLPRSRRGISSEGKPKKDVWDKLDVIFKAIASSLIAIVSVVVSIYLYNKQQIDIRAQLYTQLMSSRETADSELRKAMFDTIIKELLKPKEVQDRVLALEMLTYNFHDVIALGALFKQLQRDILDDSDMRRIPEKRRELQDRLQRVAAEVSFKQLASLRKDGVVVYENVFFDDLRLSGMTILDKQLSLPGERNEKKFLIEVLRKDDDSKQLKVHLVAKPPAATDAEIDATFWVGFFDFPMIDNTRLANGDRLAIVLRRWEENCAELWFAYFPSSRSSLKDKMYYEEVVDQFLETKT